MKIVNAHKLAATPLAQYPLTQRKKENTVKRFMLTLAAVLVTAIVPAASAALAGGGNDPQVTISTDQFGQWHVDIVAPVPVSVSLNGSPVSVAQNVFVPVVVGPQLPGPPNCPDGPLGHWMAFQQVGGVTPDAWLRQDSINAPRTWKYLLKDNFVFLRYPGYGGLDVWIDNGSVHITPDNALLLNGRRFDEATFKCDG